MGQVIRVVEELGLEKVEALGVVVGLEPVINLVMDKE